MSSTTMLAIGDMAQQLAGEWPAIYDMLVGEQPSAAWLLGVFMVGVSFFRLQKHAERPIDVPLSNCLAYFIAGIFLMNIHGFLTHSIETFFGTGTSILLYPGSSGYEATDWVIRASIGFIKIVGIIAMIKGLMLLRHIGMGYQAAQQGGGFARALTHIIGGTLAINFTQFVGVIANSLGLDNPLTITAGLVNSDNGVYIASNIQYINNLIIG